MHKLSERGVVNLLVPLILLLGIIGGVFLVTNGNPLKLFSKAAPTLPSGPETSFELELEKTAVSPFSDESTPTYITNGTNFRVDIYARADVDAANLFNAKIKYTSDTAEFVGIEKRDGQSFVKNWVDTSVDNSNISVGVISMVGGVPNPGIKTDSQSGALLMGSIIFKAKKIGTLKVEVSDSSAIYSNTSNINILSARKGLIEIPISDIQPSPTPTPQPLSCGTISVTGAIEGRVGDQTIYIVDSEGKANLQAFVTPENSKVAWTGWNSVNLPNGGTWNPPDSPTTVWTAPKNSGNTAEGVQVRADIAGVTPVVSCKPVNMVVRSAVQPTPSPSPVSGFGKAIKISGAGQQIEIPSNLNLVTNSAFTIEAWFKPDYPSTTISSGGSILNKKGASGDVLGLAAGYSKFSPTDPNSSVSAAYTFSYGVKAYGCGGSANYSTTEKKEDLGKWKHIAGVINGQVVYLFVNGKLVHSNTDPKLSEGFCTSNLPLLIGSGFVTGEIDEVRLSSSARYLSDFTLPTAPFEPEAVTTAIWHLDGDGKDSSGSRANSGSVVGNLQFVDSTVVGSVPSSPAPTPSPQPGNGDGNRDGKVDFVDLSILLTDFNKNGGFRTGIDLNGDGVINTFDFSLMRNLLIQKGVIKG